MIVLSPKEYHGKSCRGVPDELHQQECCGFSRLPELSDRQVTETLPIILSIAKETANCPLRLRASSVKKLQDLENSERRRFA